MTETSSPDGYVIADTIEFTVKSDGTPTKVTMKDDTTKCRFVKTDESGNQLKDVSLQLFKGKDLVDEWVTDGSAHEIIGKLIVGETYTLHEKSAPQGFKLAEDIEFTVENTAETQTITMIDKTESGSVTLYKKILTEKTWQARNGSCLHPRVQVSTLQKLRTEFLNLKTDRTS